MRLNERFAVFSCIAANVRVFRYIPTQFPGQGILRVPLLVERGTIPRSTS